jgi:hypothetical protein
VSTRVSPIERIRADIDELFASERDLGEVLEEVARLGVRLLMQTAIEAEVTEFLGRERYAHGERARPGSRNGRCPTTLKSTTGPVTIERPKLRGTEEAFASRLLGVGVSHQRLGVLGHRRLRAGLVRARRGGHPGRGTGRAGSAQQVESESDLPGLGRAVRALAARDRSDYELDYLLADASFFRYHAKAKGEPIL